MLCLIDLYVFKYLQNEFSVQFDDLFKKAWEEDVGEFARDGLYDLHYNILASMFESIEYMQRVLMIRGQLGLSSCMLVRGRYWKE